MHDDLVIRHATCVNGVSVWTGGRAARALPGMVIKRSASRDFGDACGCGADHKAS
ncbi:MAG: hypothetical protein NTV73_05175 [Hyphomicrobiales bacterium]|nr:hypothetical protein [Hyphomicrobiales bacterium]